jgi:hypothetical protein
MPEGVRVLIGDKGAKTVLRDAGRQAGQKLLENLIGHFPGVLDKEEALKRACIILEDLGFAKSIKKENGHIVIEEDIFADAMMRENLSESQKLTLVPEVVERGKIIYKYS